MTTDSLSQGTPMRLLRKRGRWALEFTRLVPVERNVLRPELRSVTETDSVVRHLRERCAPALVREALDIIGGDDDGVDRAFEVVDETWVPTVTTAAESQAPMPRSEVHALVTDLRAELVMLRALHDTLRSRIAALESQSAAAGDAPDRGRRPTTRRDIASMQGRAGRRSSAPPPRPSVRGGLGVAPTEALKPNGGSPHVELPGLNEVTSALRALLGTDPELAPELDEPRGDLSRSYVSRLLDGAGNDLAAVLCDTRAGAELGGRLLGLPAATQAEQAVAGIGDDVLEALNEVGNTFGSLLNRFSPGTQARIMPFSRPTPGALEWLSTPRACLGVVTRSGGRLWLLSR